MERTKDHEGTLSHMLPGAFAFPISILPFSELTEPPFFERAEGGATGPAENAHCPILHLISSGEADYQQHILTLLYVKVTAFL